MSQERGSILVVVPDINLTSLHQIRIMARERAMDMGGTLLADTLDVSKVEHEAEVDGQVVNVTVWHYRWEMVRNE